MHRRVYTALWCHMALMCYYLGTYTAREPRGREGQKKQPRPPNTFDNPDCFFALRSEKRINTSTVYSEQHTSSIYPSNPEMSRINSQKGAGTPGGSYPKNRRFMNSTLYNKWITQWSQRALYRLVGCLFVRLRVWRFLSPLTKPNIILYMRL